MIKICPQQELEKVAELSKQFCQENICNGIVPDSVQDLQKENVFVMYDNQEIIGYAYGHFEIAQKDKTYYRKGDKSFSLEEIYIKKDYRKNGNGKKLYTYVENFAKDSNCTNIQVVAVSKNYKALLKFYIEELDFNFWSAWLIKPL